MNRRRLGLAVRIVGLAIFLAIFARQVDVDAVGATLGRPGVWGWVATGGLFYAAGHFCNGLGWRGLLGAAGVEVGIGRMFRHDLSSVFWSTVLPGGVAGEVVKGVRLAGEGGRGGDVAVAIVVSHLVGGTTACLGALAMLPWTSFSDGLRTAAALALGIVVSGACVALAAVRIGPGVLRARLPRVAARIPMGAFPGMASIGRCALCGVVAHGSFAVVYAMCFGAAGQSIAFPDAMVLSTLSSVAQMAPVSFGGFGIRELTVSQIGAAIVPAMTANAAAIVLSVLWSGMVLSGGLVELLRLRAGAAAPQVDG